MAAARPTVLYNVRIAIAYIWTNSNVPPQNCDRFNFVQSSKGQQLTAGILRFFLQFPLLPSLAAAVYSLNPTVKLDHRTAYEQRSNNINNYFCLSSKRVLFPSYVDFHITLTVNIASRRKGGKTEERSSSFFTINISVFFLFFFNPVQHVYLRKKVRHPPPARVCVCACFATKNNSSAPHDSARNKKTTLRLCCCIHAALVGI